MNDDHLYLDFYFGKILQVLFWIGAVSFGLACLVAYWSLR